MKDDDKFDSYIYSTPRGYSHFFKQWVDSLPIADKPAWIGVDWAKDSGMNRGDVIKRDGNITHVRFRSVAI